MRRPIFGRRTEAASPPPPSGAPVHPGHAAVLTHLRQIEGSDPLARLQLAGRIVFDLTCDIIKTERGVRIEDAVAVLASTGGFTCIHSTLAALAARGQTREAVGIVTARGTDGQDYLFGDAPNRLLLESEHALLSLALGAAHHLGANVSLEMVHETMGRVASSVGGPEFGVPMLPPQHRPGDLPIHYVRYLWPKIVEALDLYEVPVEHRATAIGFALQRAIDAGKEVLDPMIAAAIAVECAVPMAKLDPARFGWEPQ